jgi:serine/threonine-protein kinase RsbW
VTSILASDLNAVDPAMDSVHRFALALGFDESDLFDIALAAREILINAIRHGNRFDPAKTVTLQLSTTPESLSIEVTDQGEGFVLEDVPNPHLPENIHRRSGRGLNLAFALMDEVRIENAVPGGTRVRLTKHRK